MKLWEEIQGGLPVLQWLAVLKFQRDILAKFANFRDLSLAFHGPAPSPEMQQARQRIKRLKADANLALEQLSHTGGLASDDTIRQQAAERLTDLRQQLGETQEAVATMESQYGNENGVACPT